MPKPFKVQLKPKANDDLTGIYLYSFNNFGKNRAKEYIAEINKAFLKISQKNAPTKYCDHIEPKLMKLNINSHIIFFKKYNATIEVIRILHQSQDFRRHL